MKQLIKNLLLIGMIVGLGSSIKSCKDDDKMETYIYTMSLSPVNYEDDDMSKVENACKPYLYENLNYYKVEESSESKADAKALEEYEKNLALIKSAVSKLNLSEGTKISFTLTRTDLDGKSNDIKIEKVK
ncbi:hypothetical protein E0494_06255 [Marinilabiliaceae bacterium JC040]|nr:hypothetical protein [Marinilabiliaceae bacterium JC040]